MVDAPILPADEAERTPTGRSPLLGYVMVTVAGLLWALNGVVSKVILASGLSSLRLAEVRSSGAAVVLGAALLAARRRALSVSVRELPFLIVFGVFGLALVQFLYFVAIHRLAIGVALIIQYLGPVFVALWARFVMREQVRFRIWIALVLALVGLSLVVDLWGGIDLNGVGVAAALIAAVCFAFYILLAEHAVGNRDPVSLVWFGFLFAGLFWALVQPWWSFPGHLVTENVSLRGHLSSAHLPVWMLIGWVVLLGTVVPFRLLVGALRHLPATRVSIVAMVEPVAATGIAYAWLGESLGAAQLVGGAVVLAGIVLAQTAR
jgi:drug/metabolite transporter (DMT)-like permease